MKKNTLHLKNFLALFAFVACTIVSSYAQSNQWTWVAGEDALNTAGVYGTKGTAASTNKPGARQRAASWTDASGNFWLFGGQGFNSSSSGYLNDLWKWDGTNWTWVSGDDGTYISGDYGTKGIAASSNKPGARYGSFSWTDASGNLWLFGGQGYNSGGMAATLNDLWKWDGTNWTWVSGDDALNTAGVYGTKGTAAGSNKPGARQSAVTWTDASGNLWLFGGYGYNSSSSGRLNDLWKWDGINWTWVSGDDGVNTAAVYGTKGTAAGTNKPGSRQYAVSWTDASGNFWLFGGTGYGSSSPGNLNDLWKWDGTNWTWVSGDNVLNTAGVYGNKGTAAGTNKPGTRYSGLSWTDASGNLWLLGGNGYGSSSSSSGILNDLWKWDGTNWTWVSGDDAVSAKGVYGTKGTAAGTNILGARRDAISWADASGNLWLFGGYGYNSSSAGYLNDLWKYVPEQPITFIGSTQDGDWEDATTWGGGVVPVATDSVKVKHNVNVTTTTGKVKIVKLVVDNAAGAALLDISSSDSFIVAKDIIVTGESATNPVSITVGGASIVQAKNIKLDNTISGSTVSLEVGGSSHIIVKGNLTMDAKAAGEALLDLSGTSVVYITGNILRPNGYGAASMGANATISYNGTAAQIFTSYDLGAGDVFSHTNVIVNNAAGMTMEVGKGGARITNAMTFTNGIVTSTAADHPVFFGSSASATGASNASHISGPSTKTGASTFTFPAGKGGKVGKIGISDPGATGDFTGEYFLGYPPDYTNISPSINNISELEYWDLARNSGTSSAFVTLHWDNADSSAINDLTDLRVLHYTGGIWVDEYQSATSGAIGSNSGSIVSSGALTSFSPFTFGSNSITVNSLPVELVAFTAVKQDANTAKVSWSTASESNANYFEIQRSTDGTTFNAIGTVNAIGNTNSLNEYHFLDNDLASIPTTIVFYRLVELDYEGKESVSKIVPLELDRVTDNKIVSSLLPNPFKNSIQLNLNPNSGTDVEILVADVLGRVNYYKSYSLENGLTQTIDLSTLPNGVYFISVLSNGQKETFKTVKY